MVAAKSITQPLTAVELSNLSKIAGLLHQRSEPHVECHAAEDGTEFITVEYEPGFAWIITPGTDTAWAVLSPYGATVHTSNSLLEVISHLRA